MIGRIIHSASAFQASGLVPALAWALALAMPGDTQAQSRQVQLRGRVLEKANLAPVPGATVKLVGTALTAVTDAKGEFVLSGSTAVLPASGNASTVTGFRGHYLAFPASLLSARPEGLPFDAAGRSLFRPNPSHEAAKPPLSKQAAAATQLEAGSPLLLTRTVDFAADTGKVPDIILEYPPRKLDVGAPPIHGALVLFSGDGDSAVARAELEAKWVHWINPWRASRGLGGTPVLWKIRPDPEDLTNPRKRTISPCCLPRDGSPEWGYDDLQSKAKFKDFQLHIEFNMWGGPNDANSGAYTNSGVYLQSRYEIQIETPPNPWNPTNNHGIASIIDEFPPSRNAIRAPGKWQAYDITFRAARWNGNTRTEKARMTIWWNGVLVHDNRDSGGPLANPGIGGASMDSTSQGLKLQNEKGLDVRFRNIWVKELNIAQPQTNFGY